jgi:hypothetical protein
LKKLRLLEEPPLPTRTTDEVHRETVTASPEVSAGLSLPAAAIDDVANNDEDSKLKDAVHKHGGKYWFAIVMLVAGRTRSKYLGRWHEALAVTIEIANGHPGKTGKWAYDEDCKLRGAIQTHGCRNWVPVAALVPG